MFLIDKAKLESFFSYLKKNIYGEKVRIILKEYIRKEKILIPC